MSLITNQPLLPCPFCGEDGVLFEDYRYAHFGNDVYRVYGVMCANSDCIMHQQQRFYLDEYNARRAWNKRTMMFIAKEEE